MQAIILAAGSGLRLGAYTKSIPKALLSVKGTPMIINTLNVLYHECVDEIIIVIGYMGDQIVATIGDQYRGMKISYVLNNEYQITNNMYSLFLAGNLITDDLLLLECDIFFNNKSIECLRGLTGDCSIVVSPYNANTMDGSIVFSNDMHTANMLLTKAQQDPLCRYSGSYKTVNIYKFRRDFFLHKLIPTIAHYMSLFDRTSYYELALGALIYYHKDDISTRIIPSTAWYEIDDENDLMIAERSELEKAL